MLTPAIESESIENIRSRIRNRVHQHHFLMEIETIELRNDGTNTLEISGLCFSYSRRERLDQFPAVNMTWMSQANRQHQNIGENKNKTTNPSSFYSLMWEDTVK